MNTIQKIRKFISLLILIALFLAFQFNFTALGTAYWGEGDDDCIAEHGISHHYATWIETPNIIIDGVDNDTTWSLSNVYQYTIPMANERTSPNFFISYMYCKYVYDANYLYIRATWNDTTTGGGYTDMAFWCWDINCTNYSSKMMAQTDSMRTEYPNEYVDSWLFSNFNTPNETIRPFNNDKAFGYEGWLSDDTVEANLGYIFGFWRDPAMNYYQLEIRRPLTTSDTFDIKFKEETPVRFSTAVSNALPNQEHAISWTYDLNLTHNPQPDTYGMLDPPEENPEEKPQENPSQNYTIYYIGGAIAAGAIILISVTIKSKSKGKSDSL